ncbi:zinc finger protein 280C isoform X3 [Gadus morhua]|uniref:zinc finger protein 280C isoform X3 n=1 Tax=Gadus morhua TaxID=8049 RepID=UPI0011B7D9B0|nr:zinc finger protein 280C-like isoform X3 [Gadus morhua]
MSELFMECEEEELEPWQRPAPEVTLVEDDDDDDEPIFIGELVNSPKVVKPSPSPVRIVIPRQEAPPPAPRGATPIMLSASVPGNGAMTSPPPLPTIPPHPVIINSQLCVMSYQGYIVQPHQLGPANLLATLGKQYPPGTSFTIVPAGQPHLLPLLPQARIMPGVVHRPQVKLNNNVVTLSNVQNPAVYSSPAPQPPEIQPPKPPPVDICSVTATSPTESKGDRSLLKRRLMPTQNEVKTKKVKLEPVQNNKAVDAQYVYKKKCYKCKVIFHHQEALKSHLKNCSGKPVEMVSPSPPPSTVAPVQVVNPKHILLVGEFYYGRVEGDWQMQRQEHKTNTTFKCQSCLKVLKNNIRFMNHMKHHLELEKQSSESWVSYTTCQHCYRQYMTPYQLQLHVERAHSPLASSTNCKICELAFETEQVLLEHMKETHKPGEMPYVCQVCNFRSSFFMEVEAHFKVAHDNTKDLLCPFCLKVLRSGHSYMQHYMKHQRKGIHRCGKCRLNFLTHKERVDHKINFHKTFKKPKALEGLPPGTKVTIRASLGGTVSSCNPCPSGNTPDAQPPKPAKSKPKPPQALGRAKTAQPKRQQEARVSKKNTALKNTRIGGGPHTCIECSTEVTDFFSHYPMISNCGACKYQTSCKVSISNHMIRYHSTISKDRFKRMGSPRMSNPTVKSLSCLSCDFLVGALEGDKMTKHLTDDSDHVCRVIERKVAAPAPGVMLQSTNFDSMGSMTGPRPPTLKPRAPAGIAEGQERVIQEVAHKSESGTESGMRDGTRARQTLRERESLCKGNVHAQTLIMENKRRNAYNAAFKLKAVNLAVKEGNRAAARGLGIHESMLRRWRCQREELSQCNKSKKAFRGNKSRWPKLEDFLEDWVNTQRADGRGVSTVQIRLKAKTVATEMKIENFSGAPSWCFRFMRRKGLSIRARTTV